MRLSLQEATIEYNRGVVYIEKKNYKKAIQQFKKTEKLFPCMEIYNNMGVCYRALGQDRYMLESYQKGLTPGLVSITEHPNDIRMQILNNLGLAHFMFGRDDEALKCYREAISMKKEAWDAWWNASTAWLRKASTSGDPEEFANGWKMYNARFLKSESVKMKNNKENLEYWDKKSSGKSILVLVEQGIGDSIMFGRYLPLLKQYFENVYVQTDPSLSELYTAIGAIPVQHASECDAEVAYPICSLAECFDHIPNGAWLSNCFDTHDFGPGIHVGIIFSGNPSHANNAYRSIPINRFHSLCGLGAELYCLQPGFTGDRKIHGLNPSNWTETAQYMNGLDLVIGVDTSGMHLCGTLGRPGWLLQPYKETDFRWGRTDLGGVFGSSVWYDSIKVFNNPQSWEFVFNNVKTELIKFVNDHKK